MTPLPGRADAAFYREHGYLAPFDGIDPADAAAMCRDLERFRREAGMSAGDVNMKAHLCFRRSHEFCFEPRILDVVEALIGADILVFAARFWIKGGNDGAYVSWHQDSAYFGLDPHELVTVWLALTDSNSANGCVRVLPGTHRGESHSHVETFHQDNLLARGQSIEGIDDSGAVDLELRAGQFSCHHERIVHGSLPNATDSPRIGLAIFYIPTHVRSVIGRRTAFLVRGKDRHGHWDPDPAPGSGIDLAMLEHVRAASARYTDPKYAQEAGA